MANNINYPNTTYPVSPITWASASSVAWQGPTNQSPFLNNAAAAATKEQMIAILNGRISKIKKQYGDEFLERVKKMINLRELIESLSPSQEEKLAELWDIALGALQ